MVGVHAQTETADNNSKDAFYDELNASMSKIPREKPSSPISTENRHGRDHFKTLLNRQVPSAPELDNVHRSKYAVNEQPPTEESDRNLAAVYEATFHSPHRGRLLNAFRADGAPVKFVRSHDDMNQRTTAAVRTAAGYTTPFEVITGVKQGAVAGPFLSNFAIDNIMRRTADQCPASF
ncbi:hypothetical protein RB195_021056 [Necator americanus]|uniref:Reverse transcriptase domain-containing protein n=1 Tax=Necator americanus TaxID=51031 RepID=A0ABR1E9I6_NECAM